MYHMTAVESRVHPLITYEDPKTGAQSTERVADLGRRALDEWEAVLKQRQLI